MQHRNMKSQIDPAMLQAYLTTDYLISDDPPLLLRIGEENDDARILMASFGVTTAAFLTAWNPGSHQLDDDENDLRQAELLREIESRRLNYLVGQGQRDDWIEYSYFVLGVSREEAVELGNLFEQNAFVWIDDKGIPELVNLV